MAHHEALDRLVREITTQVRWRRAEHYGLRGVFWGALAAVVPLLLRTMLGPWALPLAIALLTAGALAGVAWGLSKRVSAGDAARIADREFGLADRLSTALDWGQRDERPALVDTLVADAIARVEAVQFRQVVRRIVPREAKWLPAPVALAVVLALSPAVPLPRMALPDFSPAGGREEARERADGPMLEDRARPLVKDKQQRPAFEERDWAQRGASGAAATAGDLSAIFKDTSLANQRPDFNSFLKKGDERLKMLEQMDRLPDLQSDFTSSQYKMVFKKSKELRGGLRPDQISPQKLKELLEEMERLGRKNGNNQWGQDVGEGMEALEGGNTDKAMEAMQKALDKMRAQEDASRGGKNLRGGRDRGDGRGRDSGGRGDGSPDDQDFAEGEGSFAGKGKSGSPKGDPTQRLRASPFDAGVEGESRRGKKDGYDTNMTGRGGKMPSRLTYMGVIGQYKKAMEDAITREQIPRDFHGQIKDYFQALDER
ncbi:MAG: hypothetical protein FJ027_01840 [Candidatus Rokubacteria bacterium]|nr:hypothetical protein [Candidatus Rokubacteria bacterium]